MILNSQTIATSNGQHRGEEGPDPLVQGNLGLLYSMQLHKHTHPQMQSIVTLVVHAYSLSHMQIG